VRRRRVQANCHGEGAGRRQVRGGGGVVDAQCHAVGHGRGRLPDQARQDSRRRGRHLWLPLPAECRPQAARRRRRRRRCTCDAHRRPEHRVGLHTSRRRGRALRADRARWAGPERARTGGRRAPRRRLEARLRVQRQGAAPARQAARSPQSRSLRDGGGTAVAGGERARAARPLAAQRGSALLHAPTLVAVGHRPGAWHPPAPAPVRGAARPLRGPLHAGHRRHRRRYRGRRRGRRCVDGPHGRHWHRRHHRGRVLRSGDGLAALLDARRRGGAARATAGPGARAGAARDLRDRRHLRLYGHARRVGRPRRHRPAPRHVEGAARWHPRRATQPSAGPARWPQHQQPARAPAPVEL